MEFDWPNYGAYFSAGATWYAVTLVTDVTVFSNCCLNNCLLYFLKRNNHSLVPLPVQKSVTSVTSVTLGMTQARAFCDTSVFYLSQVSLTQAQSCGVLSWPVRTVVVTLGAWGPRMTNKDAVWFHCSRCKQPFPIFEQNMIIGKAHNQTAKAFPLCTSCFIEVVHAVNTVFAIFGIPE